MALYVEARPPKQSIIILSNSEVAKLAQKGVLPQHYQMRTVNGTLGVPVERYSVEEITNGGVRVHRIYEG